MFSIVIQSWKTSLSIFLPQKIASGIINAAKVFYKAIKDLFLALRWLVAADMILTVIIAEAVSKKIKSGAGFTFLCFLMELNWFIIYGAIVTLIRKRDDIIDAKIYLKTMLFRYILIMFIFQVFFFFLVCTISPLNLSKLPSLHWSIVIPGQVLKSLIIFYWLDSNFRLVDFFASTEKAANLIFYNIPVFIIFFSLIVGSDFLLRSAFSGTLTKGLPILLDKKLTEFIHILPASFAQFKFILIRYTKIMLEIFWLCILFVFYDKKHNLCYNENIFDSQNHEND